MSSEQKNEVQLALANLGLDVEAEFKINNADRPDSRKYHDTKDSKPNAIKLALEEDEQFWIDSRYSLFAEGNTDRHYYLKPDHSTNSSSCFINPSSFKPQNIRGYLTLYNFIWIVLPLYTNMERTLAGLNITENELIELASTKRVGFVVPGFQMRYAFGMLAKIIEAAPNSVIFSKRLAAASIAESRRRNPLIFPNLNNEDRRSVLDLLADIESTPSNPLPRVFIEHFSAVWPALEYSFSELGAIGMMRNGLGRVAESIARECHNMELGSVIYETMASVEWAAALGAAYSPARTDDFNEGPLAEFSASIMTGVKQVSPVGPVCDMDILINGILCLDNDAPIIEVTEAFKGGDLISLQKIIHEHAKSGELLSNYANELNKKIRAFEKKQSKLQKMDLLGLVSAASAIGGSLNSPSATATAAYIPVSVWVLQKIFMQSDSLAKGPILDWIRAKRFSTSSDAVLVSRLRRNME